MHHQRYTAIGSIALALAACDLRGESGRGTGGAVREPEVTSSLPPVGTLPPGVSAAAAEEGRDLYGRTCVMCHGEELEGTPLGPSLTDTTWLGGRTGAFESVVSVVRDGVAAPDSFPVPMPARGDGTLTDAQVRAVAAYAHSVLASPPR